MSNAPRGRIRGSRNHPPGLPTEWASDKQLAERYSVSRATIWRWNKEGHLPPPAKIGGATRWRVADADTAIIREAAK